MSRNLRSGRRYDPLIVPAAPKRRTRAKSQAQAGDEDDGKHDIIKASKLTVSSIVPDEQDVAPAPVGAGKRRGVAYVRVKGVKIPPTLYFATHGRPPPIRPSRLITAAIESGAHADADASMISRDAADPEGEAAERTPVTTPPADKRGEDFNHSSDEDNNIFVTARTSRVRNDSVSNTTEGVLQRKESAGQIERADEAEVDSQSLPEVDSSWVNPDWSRSAYLSAPAQSEPGVGSETSSVVINAVVYQLDDDYIFSDGKYADVLRNLREESESREAPSQTSGAGPSGRRTNPRVTVEEVDDDDAQSARSLPSESEVSATSSVKGKSRKKYKKKKKKSKRTDIPELGVEIDQLKRPGKVAEEQRARRHSSGRFDQSRTEQTPPGFRSGGYLELMHGDVSRRTRDKQPSGVQPPGSDATCSQTQGRRDRTESERRSSHAGSARTGGTAESRGGRPSEPTEPSDESNDGTYRNETDPEGSDSDPSDESSDSDSSSSDENEAQAPKSYNGEPDFDKFELFVFNYDNWCMDTQLSTKKCVRNVSRFLEGKASVWYMSNVAPNLNSYDMKSIYQGIFDYCFPPDFKENLRRNYMRKFQGDQSVQDYFAELELMRRRLKITENQHVHRVYDSAARYIKGEWAIKGILHEDTTIEELRTTALDIERAHKIRKSIEQQDHGKHKRNRSRSPDRRDNKKNDHHRADKGRFQRRDDRKEDRRDDNKGDNKPNRTKHVRERSENWKNKPASSNPKAAKTAKQRDEYRAVNKCFECGETRHLVKDCPSCNQARPSKMSTNAVNLKPEDKVRASSVLLKELDKLTEVHNSIEVSVAGVEVFATGLKKNAGSATEQRVVERNATRVKDLARKVPNTIVVQAEIEGKLIRALLDSGSQANLVSTTLVDQLRLNKCALAKPLQLQMAMSGSRGTLMYNVTARSKYQEIDETHEFDVGNLESYNAILGTPFLFQHSIRISFNPNSVFIGSVKPLPLEGNNIITINSLSTDVVAARVNELRAMLREEAEDLCREVKDTPLPPFRAINHIIPLIDHKKIYNFRPSHCPEALKPQFEAKAREYLKTGRWKMSTGTNTIPMLFTPKPKKTPDETPKLRTVLDEQQLNDNTQKLASPLPNIEEILSTVSKYKYRTQLDGKDAYEQIRAED